ncbi:hypothetical protein [Natrinema soli]|uniref:Uncharacterized protein n=1 Tax=Natrinema soli TaxID=1930624 RepID=A0ABD5SHF2_9EURY|nr:hypothetical protein [Natrinema soli]
MPDLAITEYDEYETFAQAWQDDGKANETETQLSWQLPGQFDDNELLIRLPEWLAEEKIGFVDGKTPTEFVGQIDRQTEQAIHFTNSAVAPSLKRLAHRIQHLEKGIENAGDDETRSEWLENQLQEKRHTFDQRTELTGLSEEWIPKSQVQRAVRRKEPPHETHSTK